MSIKQILVLLYFHNRGTTMRTLSQYMIGKVIYNYEPKTDSLHINQTLDLNQPVNIDKTIHINGSMRLGCDIVSNGVIHVGSTMYISGRETYTTPRYINVTGSLYVYNSNVTKFTTDILSVGRTLDILDSEISDIPNGTFIGSTLYTYKSQIKHFMFMAINGYVVHNNRGILS